MHFEHFDKERGYELSEAERKSVERIETLPITDSNKIDLILSWKGLKKAIDIGVTLKTWQEGERPPDISEEEKQKKIKEAIDTIKSLGLEYTEGGIGEQDPRIIERKDAEPMKFPGSEWQVLYVAQSKEVAERIKNLWKETSEKNNEVKTCVEIGRLSGYPESAIQTYQEFFRDLRTKGLENKISIDQAELPEEVQSEDYMAFSHFRLSRGNWREELKTVKAWADEIQKMDPKLYQRVVDKYHEDQKER